MNISDHPDYSVIQQIQDSLWQKGDVRGAAVMIGAGFSRMALLNSETTPPPPLWRDFSRAMNERLYPKGDGPTEPLKLAQEYKAALGQPALDGLIRTLIQDDQLNPGPLHEQLLSLPWADVLTTNWDTLLESTVLLDTERVYDVVQTPADIARTRAPRIVKLHGSFPSTTPFIFTEDDFRTYPKKFAPFVNLAQQTLLENELCLLGFSGDDPNFLQWAGWVRDHLGDASRQIRLIGVLNLSSSRKEMLKQQNITTVDLACLVLEEHDDNKHAVANTLFIEALTSAKPLDPYAWTATSKSDNEDLTSFSEASAQQLLSEWKNNRLHYPGWLVCTKEVHFESSYNARKRYALIDKAMSVACENSKSSLLTELAFQHEIDLSPLPDKYCELIKNAYVAVTRHVLSQNDQIRLCAYLFAESRRKKEYEHFDFWESQLENLNSDKAKTELAYGRALRAKENLDFKSVKILVHEITGDDPVWLMRQGMLFAFLHDSGSATKCFKDAIINIKARRANDKHSAWLLSREAWARWVYGAASLTLPRTHQDFNTNSNSDWPTRYALSKCDPHEILTSITLSLHEETKSSYSNKNEKRARFDAGHFSEILRAHGSKNYHGSFTHDTLIRLQESAGIPSQIDNMILLGNDLIEAFENKVRLNDHELDYSLAASLIEKYDTGLIDIAFNRIRVAKIQIATVHELIDRLKCAVDFAITNGDLDDALAGWISQLIVHIELISRLCVRLPPSEARGVFDWAVTLSNSPKIDHWWLFKPLENILCRSIEAIPIKDQGELLEIAINFPLPGEKTIKGIPSDWPELIERLDHTTFVAPPETTAWNHRIESLIDTVRTNDGTDRSRAMVRLVALHQARHLNDTQTELLAKAVWGSTNESADWPVGFELVPFIFIELPEVFPNQAFNIFNTKVIDAVSSGKIDLQTMQVLHMGLKNSEDIASKSQKNIPELAHACLNWDFRSADSKGPRNTENKEVEHLIAVCLTDTLLPNLTAKDISEPDKQLWKQLLNNSNWLVSTASEYARLYPTEIEFPVSAIRRAIGSKNSDRVVAGFSAITHFSKSALFGVHYPTQLSVDVVNACEEMKEAGLPSTLRTTTELVLAGHINHSDLDNLSNSVIVIWNDYSYDDPSLDATRNISLTLVRTECAKLVDALLNAGSTHESLSHIRQDAIEDPIPEVRFAISI